MKLILPILHILIAPSPPARGRGLKLADRGKYKTVKVSPPARGRGLKRLLDHIAIHQYWSPPARGRGLKRSLCWIRNDFPCRPPRGGVD